MLNINLSNKIKNLLKKSNKIEMNDSSYEALDLLAEQMKINIEHLYIQLQIAIDKETSINATAFSMYLGNLINLKNKLDYELKKYGSTSSENEMEVYKNLEGLIHDCRILVTNNNFQFDKAQFDLLITTGESITTNELKRYVHNSLV